MIQKPKLPPFKYEESEFCKLLKALSSSLVCNFDAKHGSRYCQVALPSFAEVVVPVHKACTQLVERSKKESPTQELAWDAQAVLLIGLQTLIAPIRGKPFWSQVVHKSSHTSM